MKKILALLFILTAFKSYAASTSDFLDSYEEIVDILNHNAEACAKNAEYQLLITHVRLAKLSLIHIRYAIWDKGLHLYPKIKL
jgi:hypothetical protein